LDLLPRPVSPPPLSFMLPPPPRPTLFPYTTLFRSHLLGCHAVHPAFGVPNQLERLHRTLLHPIGYRRSLDHSHQLVGDAEGRVRSEEHTSELQSPCNLVCRLLLEKKK